MTFGFFLVVLPLVVGCLTFERRVRECRPAVPVGSVELGCLRTFLAFVAALTSVLVIVAAIPFSMMA